MFIHPNLRSVQSIRPTTLKPEAREELKRILKYLSIRNWEFSSYTSLMEKAKHQNMMVKKLLLDSDLQLTGENGRPIVVLYQLDNQVAAYSLVSTMSQRIGRLSRDTVKLLPTTTHN